MDDLATKADTSAPGSPSVLGRFGAIIGLFSEDTPRILLEDVQQHLGISGATAYRYLSALCELGILSRLSGRYTIGPKVLELNHLMRTFDPMLLASTQLIRDLAANLHCHVLLSRIFGVSITQIYHAKGAGLDDLNFIPGRRMPMFRGSQARIILATLERRKLRRIYDAHEGHADRDKIGKDWKSFSKALMRNRRDGFYISRSELDADTVGIAAPIYDSAGDVLGSLTAAYRMDSRPTRTEAELVNIVVTSARQLSEKIGHIHQEL